RWRAWGPARLLGVREGALAPADRGYPRGRGLGANTPRVERLLRGWPASAELSLPVPRPGERIRNRDLAETYRRVLAESAGEIDAARDVFYRGFVADAIASFLDGTEALLSRDDLDARGAHVERP